MPDWVETWCILPQTIGVQVLLVICFCVGKFVGVFILGQAGETRHMFALCFSAHVWHCKTCQLLTEPNSSTEEKRSIHHSTNGQGDREGGIVPQMFTCGLLNFLLTLFLPRARLYVQGYSKSLLLYSKGYIIKSCKLFEYPCKKKCGDKIMVRPGSGVARSRWLWQRRFQKLRVGCQSPKSIKRKKKGINSFFRNVKASHVQSPLLSFGVGDPPSPGLWNMRKQPL